MSDNLNQALVELQEATEAAKQATEDITRHNEAENAHPHILKILNELRSTDAIYTNDQIIAIVEEQIANHLKTNFRQAHPGFDEWEASNTEALEAIRQDFYELKDRVDQWENAQGSSDLSQQIQEVQRKYQAQLEALQMAWQEAVENNQTALADQYRETIAKVTEQMLAEIEEVRDKWQQAQQPEKPTVQIYISFNANGGTGEMNIQYLNQGETFIYPECTFTPPEGMEFEKWSSNETGDGAYTGLPGSELDTTPIASSLTLYAIWKETVVSDGDLEEGKTLQIADKAKVTMKLVKTMRV